MTDQTPAAPDRIFISYRREETAYAAGWLYDRLVDHFGRSRIFKDVDSIQLGDDYVDVINEAVGSCDVSWTDVRQVPANGFYVDGTYHVHAEPRDEGGGEVSSPHQAAAVSPAAPADVRIDVAARRVAGSDRGQSYGIVCRLDGDNFYAFSAGADGVTIEKQVDYAPFNFQLASASVSFDPDVTNQLGAECTTSEDGQSVHLVFIVNGSVVAETTDSDRPLPAGAVGVWAAMAPRSQTATQPLTAIEAEFDDFVVTAG